MTVSRLLRLEGLILLVGAVVLYVQMGGSGPLFVILLLAPDVSALGYLVDTRTGAWSYNLFHAYALPAALFAFGYALSQPLMMQIALIWFAHIGMDRTVGYGLKYPTEFKDTHLQHV